MSIKLTSNKLTSNKLTSNNKGLAISVTRQNRNLAGNHKAFTIIELMIAGVLGIILTAGIIQLFVGSNQNYSLQEELANIQEDGRFALIFMENEIQQAGWVEDFNQEIPNAIDIDLSVDGVTDSISISYVADVDCNGADSVDGYTTNIFSVGGFDGEQFLCQGDGTSAAQPLIDGVKGFQVLYGVESNAVCPDGVVNEYLTRDQLNAVYDSVIVVSVRVALLLSSKDDVLPTAESKTHRLLDTELITNNKLAYRIFQQTIFMPNSLFSGLGNPNMALDCVGVI